MVEKPFNFEAKSFKVSMFSWNVFLHVLMGIIVGIPLAYAFSFVKDNQSFSIYLHILLLVPGFQLLMGQSFLGLAPFNAWSTELNTVEKRRAHWIIALLSSILVIIGSFYVMVFKTVNFYSLHGKFGLVALVFTIVNLFTGVGALFPTQFKRVWVPPSLSKITHLVFGIVAFATSGISLCYSYDKNAFKNWIGAEAAMGTIVITGLFTAFLCINPVYTTYKRCYQLLMGQSFLGLCPYNSWSADLNTVNKRRAHWVLATMGSILAVAGSILVMLWKNVNFNTMHGKLGLVAMVFTVVNLVTGVAALYATPLRRFCIPPSLSKISHILFGVVAFVTAGASLCYGYDKNAFINWVGAEAALGVIIFTAAFTVFLSFNDKRAAAASQNNVPKQPRQAAARRISEALASQELRPLFDVRGSGNRRV
ncbi:unnamed protein product [Chrysodeixis includens]|uniref:ascorbate ferrireductase (transmembrane) n=1 Tax=Chrysodeixis includens TaxID=689277 RepID=A0A9N8KVI5_CHRIL|nr:unnamed protein product [Chrysodeixis includens]